jgi:hypothetical protein
MKGFIKRTGDHRYRIWLHVGGGKQRTFGVHGTRREAEAYAAKLVNEFHSGALVQPTRMTVREFLTKFLVTYRDKVAPGDRVCGDPAWVQHPRLAVAPRH